MAEVHGMVPVEQEYEHEHEQGQEQQQQQGQERVKVVVGAQRGQQEERGVLAQSPA